MSLVDPALAETGARARAGPRRRLRRALRRGAPRASASRSTTDAWSARRAGASGAPACGSCRATRPTTATSTAWPRRTCCASPSRRRQALRGRGPRARAAERGARRRRATPSRRGPRTSRSSARRTCCAPATSAPAVSPARGGPGAHRLRGVAPPGRGVQLRGPRRGGRPHARAAERPGRGAARRPRGDGHRHARRPRGLGAGRPPSPSWWPRSAARRALTLLDAVDAPTGRLPVVVGNALRRRAAARGGRPRAGGRRRPEARQRLRRPARRAAGRAVRDRLRRRPPRERVGQRRDRRRGHADAPDDGDRGRQAHRLPVRPGDRAPRRRGADRQRPARVVSPPAGAAHDEHLLRAGRRHARRS